MVNGTVGRGHDANAVAGFDLGVSVGDLAEVTGSASAGDFTVMRRVGGLLGNDGYRWRGRLYRGPV